MAAWARSPEPLRHRRDQGRHTAANTTTLTIIIIVTTEQDGRSPGLLRAATAQASQQGVIEGVCGLGTDRNLAGPALCREENTDLYRIDRKNERAGTSGERQKAKFPIEAARLVINRVNENGSRADGL